MRSSATFASRAVSSSSETWFTIRPSASSSSAHARYAGWMRYIVAHGQTTGSRQKTVLSGFSRASRETRLISVPTANFEPAGASVIVRVMNSVEPSMSAACTTSITHSGCTITVIPGCSRRAFSIWATENRRCTEQCPFQRMTRACSSCSSVFPPSEPNGSV